jgi:hypothetical protein
MALCEVRIQHRRFYFCMSIIVFLVFLKSRLDHATVTDETGHKIRLHRYRAENIRSIHERHVKHRPSCSESKWTTVRPCLSELIVKNENNKSRTKHVQLESFITSINKQRKNNRNSSKQLSVVNSRSTITCSTSVRTDIDDGKQHRQRSLKYILSNQVIHVDCDGLSFSISREELLSTTKNDDNIQQTKVYDWPIEMRDILIDLSTTKMNKDCKQFKQAQLKMRLAKFLFSCLLLFIFSMLIALFISSAYSIWKIIVINNKQIHSSMDR